MKEDKKMADVLAKHRKEGEKIPWGNYLGGAKEAHIDPQIEEFLKDALSKDKWSLREGAVNIVFGTLPPEVYEDGGISTKQIERAVPEVLRALSADLYFFHSQWVLMGYQNGIDPFHFVEDTSELMFPPMAFYWWWRTGGLAKIDRYVYPIIFKEMTRTVEPLMMDLKRGASETEVLEKYPDLVTTFVLDALAGGKQYPYQYCFTYEDFPIVETEDEGEGEDEGEDEDEGSSANGVETIGARLLEALSKSVSQEKAERILERLPQWLDKRRKGEDCRPLLIATLSTLLEVEQEGLEDSPFESEKSQEKERVEAIATKNVQKAKGEVEPVNDDIKAVRRLLIRTFRVGRQKDRKKQGWNYKNN